MKLITDPDTGVITDQSGQVWETISDRTRFLADMKAGLRPRRFATVPDQHLMVAPVQATA